MKAKEDYERGEIQLIKQRLINKLSKKIADELFTNAFNEKATRLVLEIRSSERDGGGWNKSAVEDIVKKNLEKAI